MKLIGFLLIALMGSNDWQAREFATDCFDYCCSKEWLPYDLEVMAFEHKDLEIQHRARLVLEKYYVTNQNGDVDITYREYEVKHPVQSNEFATFQKKKELEGWHMTVYWYRDFSTIKCRFERIKK